MPVAFLLFHAANELAAACICACFHQPTRSDIQAATFTPDCYSSTLDHTSPDSTGTASMINLQFTSTSQQPCVVCLSPARSARQFTLTFSVTQMALHRSCELAAAQCRHVGSSVPLPGWTVTGFSPVLLWMSRRRDPCIKPGPYLCDVRHAIDT